MQPVPGHQHQTPISAASTASMNSREFSNVSAEKMSLSDDIWALAPGLLRAQRYTNLSARPTILIMFYCLTQIHASGIGEDDFPALVTANFGQGLDCLFAQFAAAY